MIFRTKFVILKFETYLNFLLNRFLPLYVFFKELLIKEASQPIKNQREYIFNDRYLKTFVAKEDIFGITYYVEDLKEKNEKK